MTVLIRLDVYLPISCDMVQNLLRKSLYFNHQYYRAVADGPFGADEQINRYHISRFNPMSLLLLPPGPGTHPSSTGITTFDLYGLPLFHIFTDIFGQSLKPTV